MAFVQGRGFRPEFFSDPEEYEETPLRDRKEYFPNLYHLERKAEFIRDLIAIANTSQYFNEPGYLLFGLDDAGEIHSIDQDLGPYEGEGDNELQIREKVRQYISQIIREYIAPSLPEFRLEWGVLAGNLVAYLQINPPPRRPSFQMVAKDLTSGKKKLLYAGQCWLRFGESKQEVGLQAIRDRDPRAEIPYVFPSTWLRYYENIRVSSEVKAAQDIYAYQELGLMREEFSLSEKADIFLESDEISILVVKGPAGSGKSVWLHRLVHQWAFTGEADVRDIMKREKFSPPPNWIPIYFSLRGTEISDVQALACELIRSVNRIATLWKAEEPQHFERLLEIEGLHWLVCLDGLDEIWTQEAQRKFLSVLRSFRRRYPRVKIILTTRADTSIPTDFQVTETAPFSESQVLAYLSSYVEMGEQHEAVLMLLRTYPELWQLCEIPVYLEAMVEIISSMPIPTLEMGGEEMESESLTNELQDESSTTSRKILSSLPKIDVQQLLLAEPFEGEDDESKEGELEEDELEEQVEREESEAGPPLTLGWILDQAFRHLWKREAERRLFLYGDVEQWWDAMGEMALYMDGRRKALRQRQVVPEFLSEVGLRWVLSLGILRRASYNGWVGFVIPLAKVYFAAAFLWPFVEDGSTTDQSVSSYISRCTPSFKDNVHRILQQLTYENVELLFREVKNE